MEVRELQYFISSASAGSFTAAAAELHISQPTLSETIRHLERALGTILFHRLGRGITLTEEGKLLLPKAREVIHKVDDIRQTMGILKGLHGGHLKIAAPPSLTVAPLVDIIGSFREQYSGLTISIDPVEDGLLAVKSLLSSASEVGIVDRPVSSSALTQHVLGRGEILVAMPPRTPHDGSGYIRLEDLTERAFISSLPGTRTRALLDHAIAAGIGPRVVVETPHREAVVPLVVRGVGHAFLTSSRAKEAADRGAVVLSLNPTVGYTVYLVHRSGPLTSAAAAFVRHCLNLE